MLEAYPTGNCSPYYRGLRGSPAALTFVIFVLFVVPLKTFRNPQSDFPSGSPAKNSTRILSPKSDNQSQNIPTSAIRLPTSKVSQYSLIQPIMSPNIAADTMFQVTSANNTGQNYRIKSQNMGPQRMGQNPKRGGKEIYSLMPNT